nr:hypothetical protein [Tanacetum cinerariifolium]
MPRECLKIIETKSKVRQTRAKAVVAKVGTSSSTPTISADAVELKDMVKALLLDKKKQSPAPTPSTTPAPVKAVELSYVTCGDADYAGCKDTFKSTSGGARFLGEKLLTDYGFHFDKILIYCDSKSAIAISCNPIQHSRTKHIVVRFHFIKEHVEKGTIELYFVKTDYQLADIFTKALPTDRFKYLVRRL